MSASKRTTCRSCLAPGLRQVINFGPQPLAGYYAQTIEGSIAHPRFPLVLDACPQCDLLQITDLPPIEQVFHADYTYSSSQVAPLVAHFADYARWIGERFATDAPILEFGCNDGVLLDQLSRLGFSHLAGVDASPNMVSLARRHGFDVVEGFFGTAIVEKMAGRAPFDLITCSNVFAHIDNLPAVLAAVRALLASGGQFCIEVHDAEKLILERQFETIYHEHLTYFSAATLRTCLELGGFELVELETTPMHGGGLRVRARKSEGPVSHSAPHARTPEEMAEIGQSLHEKIESSRERIAQLRADYGPLDGYGMAGRAQMFLAMTHTEDAFGAFYDDAPIRQGRFAVGTDKRIGAFEPTLAARACVILAWNYAEPILARIAPHYETVHVLFPEPQILK